MTVAIDAQAGERRGRVFVKDLQSVGSSAELLDQFARHFVEPEDARRVARLENALSRPAVSAAVHPGIDPNDIAKVFLQTGAADHPRVFACTIVSERRLALMLGQTTAVFENLDLQVAPGSFLTVAAIRSALEAWSSRSFPSIQVPAFDLSLWADENALNLLPIVANEDSGSPLIGEEATAPRIFRPRSTIAKPAYKDAA